MNKSNWEKGFIHLGIIGIIVLAAGLFSVTKLASNPDLTFFDIAEEAKVSEEDECRGCVNGYQLRWNKAKQRCMRSVSAKCNPIVKPKPTVVPTPTPTPFLLECSPCTSDSQCKGGLVCLKVSPACAPGAACPTPNSFGTCVKANGSSNCSVVVIPTPEPPPGCYYKDVQCVKAPCPAALVCPPKTPTPAPSTGTCSCFGNYNLCDQNQDGQTDSVFRCQNGCGVNGSSSCAVGKGELKSGELCYDDFMCQSEKCITPVTGPFKFNPPAGFSKVCY